MEAQLLECINFSLNNYLFQNAVFLAERLHAQAPSEEYLHVLATCHYRYLQSCFVDISLIILHTSI